MKKIERNPAGFFNFKFSKTITTESLLRVSEANEVPISIHIWVGLSTLNRL